MGNSQKSLKSRVKGLFNRPQNPNSKIGKATECPNCGQTFSESTTYLMYNTHLEQCLRGGSEDNHEPQLHEPTEPPEYLLHTTEGDYIYEKVPINDEKTEFRWQRRPMLTGFPSDIFSLSPETIAKRPIQQKLVWFRAQVQRLRIPWNAGSDLMKIEKDNVLMTSLAAIRKVNMHREVKIDFAKEKVNDAGGLLREWMHLAIKEIFDESTGIFALCNTPEVMYKVRSDKDLDPEFAESLFMLFGVILGKAIFERIPLNCYLDRTILRQLCAQKVKLSDVSGYDAELYKNWRYLQHNKIEPFGQYFSLYQQASSDRDIQEVLLIENGDKVEVTEQNKHQFVQLSMEYYCVTSIAKHITTIKNSLYKIIPAHLLSIFDTYEFEMVLYGVPFINLEDWIANTEYKGAYYKNHQIIKWFWKVMKQMNQQQLGKLLHFCTGSTRIPIYGFKKLQSNRGNYAKFLVESVAFSKINPFPKAHTCFNRLELPMYPTEELLRVHVFSIVDNNLDGVYGLD